MHNNGICSMDKPILLKSPQTSSAVPVSNSFLFKTKWNY